MQYKYPLAKPVLGMPEKENLVKCITDGWVSAGSFVTDFENRMALACDRKYACSTSSGTSALHLALAALGVGRGDLVIVPTLTYIACANAILYCGAVPIFCESRESDWQMDMENVSEIVKFHAKVSSNKLVRQGEIKAIIAVHLYGAPCSIDELGKFCRPRGILLIEDAAQALGSELNGRPVGSFGDVSCFSFYGNKNITTGEGGVCLTDNEKIAYELKHLKNHATISNDETREYFHNDLGYNYRMSNLQAAVGCAQLDRLDSILGRKQEICELYTSTIFRPIASGEFPEIVKTWKLKGRGVKAGRWLYSLVLDTWELREGLIKFLAENGIESRPFFGPCHSMSHFNSPSMVDFPVAEILADRGINLPTYVQMTDDDVKYISEQVIDYLRHNVR